jgi:hypothetical protein
MSRIDADENVLFFNVMNNIRNGVQVNLITATYDLLDNREREYIANYSKYVTK